MRGRRENERPALWPIVATILFLSALGVGVTLGRMNPERRSTAEEAQPTTRADVTARLLREDLASCREKLAAHAKAADVRGTRTNGRASARFTTDIELEAELVRCTKSETLKRSEVCVAARRQFDALMAVPGSGACRVKSIAAAVIERDFEWCAALSDLPADLASGALTKEESRLVADALRVRDDLVENKLARKLKVFTWDCIETYGRRANEPWDGRL